MTTTDVLLPSSWISSTWLLVFITITTFWLQVLRRPGIAKNAPKLWKDGDWPFLGAPRFYAERRDYINDGLHSSSSGSFSFYIGKKHVIGLSGPVGRRTFYDSRGLSVSGGAGDLMTGQPSSTDALERFMKWFKAAIPSVVQKDMVVLTGDTRSMLQELLTDPKYKTNSAWNVLQPFDGLYRVAYQLTMRMVGPTEIAENPKLLDETLARVDAMDKLQSGMKKIFPWLPTWTHLKGEYHKKKLSATILGVLQERERVGRREHDAMQAVRDASHGPEYCVGFVISAIIAGQISMGVNLGWIPVRLAQDPEWMRRVRDEVDSVIAKHRTSPQQQAVDVLATLSLEHWENEFPVIDACQREIIRFTLTGSAFRKNVSGRDISIGSTGEVIPNGSYATYMHENVLMDPDVYKDPTKFDPGRFLDGRDEGADVTYGYVGWGVGLHPCPGMRMAKLNLNIIMAHLVTMFEFQLSDSKGNFLAKGPNLIDRNTSLPSKPSVDVYLRYRQRVM